MAHCITEIENKPPIRFKQVSKNRGSIKFFVKGVLVANTYFMTTKQRRDFMLIWTTLLQGVTGMYFEVIHKVIIKSEKDYERRRVYAKRKRDENKLLRQ